LIVSIVANPPTTLLELRDRAIAWMNRGHELLRRGDEASLAGSLDAYNEAIALLRRLPVGGNPSWANSLGAALMNRGHLLHRLHGTGQAALALAAFDDAAAVLEAIPAADHAWPRRNLAGTLLNRANLLLDLGRLDAARAVAGAALALALPHEREHLVDADLALKARRAMADALGQLLVVRHAEQEEFARQASDTVDDALAVIRHWSAQAGTALRLLAMRFFRFGVQLYRFHQPHFLAEFIEENLPPADEEFRAIAREAIEAALADDKNSGRIFTLGDPASERRRQTLQDLDSLRARLAGA
jgi:tetratricopeptide (TPR) repeat protein